MDRLVKEMIPNDEEKEPLSELQSQGCARGDREEMTVAELAKKYGVHL